MLGFLLALIAAAASPTASKGLTLQAARAMPPEALGDRLLPSGHSKIVKAIVHPYGMEAPYASLTRVELFTEASAPDRRGLCSATILELKFKPAAGVSGDPMHDSLSMVVESSEAEEIVHYEPDTARRDRPCDPNKQAFFHSYETMEPDLKLVDQIYALKIEVAKGLKPSIDYRFEDNMAFGSNPAISSAQALAELPVDDFTSARDISDERNLPFTGRALLEGGGAFRILRMDLSGIYSADIIVRDGRITHLFVSRHIPYPI